MACLQPCLDLSWSCHLIPSCPFLSRPVLLRPSDEDWNHHLNNVAYVHFFEDALEIVRELAHVKFGVRDVRQALA